MKRDAAHSIRCISPFILLLFFAGCGGGDNNNKLTTTVPDSGIPDSGSTILPADDAAAPITPDSGSPDQDASVPSRDPLQQPFASDSIWNMPLGSNAAYVAANLRSVPGGASTWREPGAELEHIILTSTAPMVDIYESSVGWGGGDRCPATGSVLATVPIPTNFLVPSGPYNDVAAILEQDGHTIANLEPLARCTDGGIATALVRWPDVDLYGAGIAGSHGGSGLSSIGGSLRLGELRPGQTGPRHALKLTMYMKETYKCATAATCFRWPASTGDSYAVGFYGTGANNPNVNNAALTMGSLLALSPSVDIASLNLQTEAAREIAWTLQNYGAYIVDDSYDPAFWIEVEDSPSGTFTDQFNSDYGFEFNQSSDSGTAWSKDIETLLPILMVVNNNTSTTVGGGGTPRQPLAPPI